MKRLLLSALLLAGSTVLCRAADFEPPVRLKAGDVPIRVEFPGYAAPTANGLQDLYNPGVRNIG